MTEPHDAPDTPLRLNLGGGDGPQPDGYLNVDRKFGGEVFPLDYRDGSVDSIRASHVLEHFSHRQTFAVLQEWFRVLRPGGSIRVAVPDFDWICRQHLGGHRGIEGYLLGGHVDENDRHGAIFTENKLRALMHGAGFRRVRKWTSEIEDCAALPVSLNLEGFKAEPVNLKGGSGGIMGVMSVPRYVQSTAMDCIFTAIHSLGVPVKMASGPYWHQVQELLFEMAIGAGAEYILAIDSDTTFTPDDVRELYRLIAASPNVDALAPVQMARGMPGPLATFAGPDENSKPLGQIPTEWFERDMIECRSAHFGLTMVRAASLRKLAKPWFMSVPDPSGSWGPQRTDADVQFWLKWREGGNSVFIAPMVCVGHVEEVVLHPSRQLTTIVQDVGEYRRDGVPVEALR
jgi:hypothetical protein